MNSTTIESLLGAWLLLATLSCAGFDAAAPPTCTPHFPYANGWLGGDAAYSIPIGGTRSVWLFGDTFVGEPGGLNRQGSEFIHNSIAVSLLGLDPALGFSTSILALGARDVFRLSLFDQSPPSQVPEPGTFMLLLAGVIVLFGRAVLRRVE